MDTRIEEHLDVFIDRSVLHDENGETIYLEGNQSAEAQARYSAINSALSGGYLSTLYDDLDSIDLSELSEKNRTLLKKLVDGVTSEVGRALVGVAFLQLTIKSITPQQSVRLHKGSVRNGSFSWQDGISMRTIDSNHTTPFLRAKGLLNVNSFGVFMTRSLAENYPYSKLYKAEMRGPFNEWIAIVDAIEDNSLPPKLGLCFLMNLLKNRSDNFKRISGKAISLLDNHKDDNFSTIKSMLTRFFNGTEYSARAFEVVMHSFMQAMQEMGFLGDSSVVPLSQMRSANKKHGNIGDIELAEGGDIIESWDAKYGKPYLRDELEELNDKIQTATGVKTAGFVVEQTPDRRKEITDRAEDISLSTGVEIKILSFDEWVDSFTGAISSLQLDLLGVHWLTAVVESFGQKRPDIAPIDEPCDAWVNDLIKVLE